MARTVYQVVAAGGIPCGPWRTDLTMAVGMAVKLRARGYSIWVRQRSDGRVILYEVVSTTPPPIVTEACTADEIFALKVTTIISNMNGGTH